MTLFNSCLIFIAGAVLGFCFGYDYGKSMMLKLLRSHEAQGRKADAALQYEEDVLHGKVPRG